MIDRLMVLQLHAVDCEAEAVFNGVPVARASAARPRAIVPVHEYALAGNNRLELVLWPAPVAPVTDPPTPPSPPLPCVADGKQSAHLRLLLPRVGNVVDESSARLLAQLDWAPPDGQAYAAPLGLSLDVSLPVSFPRWRWLDAPPTQPTPALQHSALALLQQMAASLAAGDADSFITAVRLRTEELAVAYQRSPTDEADRLRSHLQTLAAAGALNWLPMEPDTLVLRSLAGGRLLECLDASGAPMLRTAPDDAGRSLAFPLRLAAVDKRLYVLR